jgi:thioredoxin-related protein
MTWAIERRTSTSATRNSSAVFFVHWKIRTSFGLPESRGRSNYGNRGLEGDMHLPMKMKLKTNRNTLLLCILALTVSILGQGRADDAQKSKESSIYDESADGSKQIADALVHAKNDGKHVLIQFGANWCGWCHKLHTLFDTDKSIAEELSNNYVVVMIDVNKGHNKEVDAKYGHPTRLGLPVIVILDSHGTQLTTEDSGRLEEGDHHDPGKVMDFLKKWASR